MFLDDKLTQMCKDHQINEGNHVRELHIKLCNECKSALFEKLHDNMSGSQLKTYIDKIFNLWDSFVLNLKRSEDSRLIILSELFEDHTYKKEFFKNPELTVLYKRLTKK